MPKKTTHEMCNVCPSLCCHGLPRLFTARKTRNDEDLMEKMSIFSGVTFIHFKRKWYQYIAGACHYLGKDNHCAVYEERPEFCRGHAPPECEYYNGFFDKHFKTPEALAEYFAQGKGRKKAKR